ncbi:uncharacterized protein BDR25DRAFT_396206 [Lindgomyces ingoldianus]|uniref:Uncharacterized protein n=1 Tax=Lindgomyces ingoldianus TaxID=673940 RepID=A0ACB6QF36_9PLEO|nr:uncharacterized protein BDR25DRAFT_396206 [Lindgomyces ingoldianus]KAF2465541.1 hypothetical protein BDR25DRAFT_396206 [Lindgomyces ingoldianus]
MYRAHGISSLPCRPQQPHFSCSSSLESLLPIIKAALSMQFKINKDREALFEELVRRGEDSLAAAGAGAGQDKIKVRGKLLSSKGSSSLSILDKVSGSGQQTGTTETTSHCARAGGADFLALGYTGSLGFSDRPCALARGCSGPLIWAHRRPVTPKKRQEQKNLLIYPEFWKKRSEERQEMPRFLHTIEAQPSRRKVEKVIVLYRISHVANMSPTSTPTINSNPRQHCYQRCKRNLDFTSHDNCLPVAMTLTPMIEDTELDMLSDYKRSLAFCWYDLQLNDLKDLLSHTLTPIPQSIQFLTLKLANALLRRPPLTLSRHHNVPHDIIPVKRQTEYWFASFSPASEKHLFSQISNG